MFKQLLWKEWRENLWKLMFGGAVSIAFVMLLFRIRLFPDAANCVAISFVQMLVVPVIYALDIFSGEMSNRTIHLLFKFPVPRWKMFFAKYFVSIGGMVTIFLLSGVMMEVISQGREAEIGRLFIINSSAGLVGILLFTWFCPFGAQSCSEAGSLVAIFGVMVGWAIIFLWSNVCEVRWALIFVPYNFILRHLDQSYFKLSRLILAAAFSVIVIISIACYRFVKVRRVL